MSRAYIYMEHPQTAEVITLGRLTLKGKTGEFLSKNRGIPGFCACSGSC